MRNIVPIKSDGPIVTIKLNHNQVLFQDFLITYETSIDSCGGDYELFSGKILWNQNRDISDPFWSTSANIECIWILKASNGNSLFLEIEDLNLMQSSEGNEHCNLEYIEIRNLLNNKLLGINCGNMNDQINRTYIGSGLWIKYEKSSSKSYENLLDHDGFTLNFRHGKYYYLVLQSMH